MLAVYGHIRYLKNPVEALLRYMLFTEEAPLPGPLSANPEFVGHFLKDAHRDSKGRSLRDFDLKTRLFKHRCSFLIESDSFRELPAPLRDVLLARLWEILTGQDQSEAFSKLEAASRRETLEILREVLPDLPPYWFHDAPGERPAEKPEPSHPPKATRGEAGDPGL